MYVNLAFNIENYCFPAPKSVLNGQNISFSPAFPSDSPKEEVILDTRILGDFTKDINFTSSVNDQC